MPKDFWLNLPVKDVRKSKAFFTALGFEFVARFGDGDPMAGLLISDKRIVIMLVEEETFKGFVNNEISSRGSEALLSFDAASKEEVDEFARKAEEAGGIVYGRPGGSEWMYGAGFADLDGHRWNVLYMDESKMPQG